MDTDFLHGLLSLYLLTNKFNLFKMQDSLCTKESLLETVFKRQFQGSLMTTSFIIPRAPPAQ